MTAVIEKGEKMAESLEKEENLIVPREYGCEVLSRKNHIEKAKDPSFPNDAYLIWYNVNGEQHMLIW
jgi:hypothetical protein